MTWRETDKMAHLSQFLLLIQVCSLGITAATAADTTGTVCKKPMDLVFVVDSSGSICNDTGKMCDSWRSLRDYMHAIVNDMVIGENDFRVALVQFATYAQVIWDLTTYKDKSSLLNAIDNLPYTGGNTNTIAALDLLSNVFKAHNGDRTDVKNIAIMITDGKPAMNGVPYPMDQIRAAVKKVNDQGIHLMTVGVTDSIDMVTLKELSSPPNKINETVFVAENYQTLWKVLKQLENQTCRALTFSQPPKPKEVIPACSEKLDLCFVIDGSGSICDHQPDFDFNNPQDITCNNWKDTIHFIQSIAAYFDIGLQATRIGLVEFSDTSVVRWNLTAYTERSSLLKAIIGLDYHKGGHTDMTGGIRLMRTEVFGKSNDRPDVPNVAIIMTDGFPTDPSTVPAEMDAVKKSGIRTLAVGVTNLTNEETIKSLATPPQKLNYNYFLARDIVDLEKFRKILNENTCKPSR